MPWQEIALVEAGLLLLGLPIAFWALLRLRTLEMSVRTDHLTGLFNRRGFDSILNYEVARSNRFGSLFSVLFLDLDNFKEINDQHGHGEGDRVLAAFASIIEGNTRVSDISARYGGDEFVVILSETDGVGAELVAKEILRELQARFSGIYTVTASVGVAEYPTDCEGIDLCKIVNLADEAAYQAKLAGRNCVRQYSEL